MKVRELVRLLERDGWQLARQTGSHRQYRHPTKPGTVTVAGNLGAEMKAGTLRSVLRQAGREGTEDVNDYLVVIESGDGAYSAYVPDLPGCVAAGSSAEEVEHLIGEAISMHIESLREHGEPVPAPSSSAKVVRVA